MKKKITAGLLLVAVAGLLCTIGYTNKTADWRPPEPLSIVFYQ
ncbi:hypothetical protein [Tumebacillus amylolyticus]|nr:hypothetical protein [Tumebacillus amylolyticus]